MVTISGKVIDDKGNALLSSTECRSARRSRKKKILEIWCVPRSA